MKRADGGITHALYVHIPFCEHKCGYCAFVSSVADDTRKNRYIRLLSREMELLRSELSPNRADAPALSTLYVGGGTPSCLSEDQITALFEAIGRNFRFSGDAEVTFEANPNTVTPRKSDLLIRLGVNRISMGLQSADNEILGRIGRIHRAEDFAAACEMLTSAGFQNISADLMTGLPGQTASDIDRSLDFLLGFSAIGHLSVYALRLEEGTPMHRRNPVLPSDDEERDLFDRVKRRLVRSGFRRYEISNFALPGMESRHNSRYWTGEDYLAVGLAAHSKIGRFRFANPDGFSEYESLLEKRRLPRHIVEELSDADQRFEQIMLRLRTAKGLDIGEWERRFGRRFDDDYPGVVELLTSGRGRLARRSGDRLQLTDRGFDLSNSVYTLFMNRM